MEKLVELIEQLEASDLEGRPYLSFDDHPLIPIISTMLNEIFITEGGHMNYDLKEALLNEYGYELYPVERDTCGWLIGGLMTTKGTITFG